jgi:hypothetical protein
VAGEPEGEEVIGESVAGGPEGEEVIGDVHNGFGDRAK